MKSKLTSSENKIKSYQEYSFAKTNKESEFNDSYKHSFAIRKHQHHHIFMLILDSRFE